MTLQGCAGRKADPESAPAPLAIAVETRTRPPAELTRCPERPAGFGGDAWAVMPESVRDALIRLARAFQANADRQERLIAWELGKPCDQAAAELEAPAR